MARKFVVTPAAEDDLAHAFAWYESIHAGLGAEFLECVGEIFTRIRRDPDTWPQTYKSIRQVLVRRFPYVVCFTCDDDAIRILAVFHGHRDPEVWQSRVP
jgi:toxin ParE1/3/4